MPITSGFFSTFVNGPLRAAGQIEAWHRNSVNPSGYRHHESGQYKADSKIGLIGGFDAQMESGIALDFGQIIIPDSSGFLTDTCVITFNLGEVNGHPDSFFDKMVMASSVGVNFKAFNMRLWVSSLSAFSGMNLPTFYYRNSAQWRQGYILNISDPGVQVLPSSMPDNNMFSKSPDSVFISGSFVETEFSHFIYLRGRFPSGFYPLGTYGGLDSKDFGLKCSYDWTLIDANVLPTDL